VPTEALARLLEERRAHELTRVALEKERTDRAALGKEVESLKGR
jgi:hypothetical protein